MSLGIASISECREMIGTMNEYLPLSKRRLLGVPYAPLDHFDWIERIGIGLCLAGALLVFGAFVDLLT